MMNSLFASVGVARTSVSLDAIHRQTSPAEFRS